ncbi:hypothetical protein ACFX43_22195 [Nocardioides sp. YIM B13467]|uniref:hypothetical protein n=1 Tax=Nocardioides sp. YIM B13467 TaxID=3366294 RepID=UPI0036731C9E
MDVWKNAEVSPHEPAHSVRTVIMAMMVPILATSVRSKRIIATGRRLENAGIRLLTELDAPIHDANFNLRICAEVVRTVRNDHCDAVLESFTFEVGLQIKLVLFIKACRGFI